MNRLNVDNSIFDIPSNIAVTGRIKSWLTDLQSSVQEQDKTLLDKFYNKLFGYDVTKLRRLPVSCTVYVVGDSMDEIENSIEDSWLYTSHALRNGAGVAIHLSNLRPKNTPNGKGLVSSGPVSFAQIYSKLNEILRRGGTFRNGAVVVHLDYNHPDIVEFATAPRELLPWARRAINVDDDFINHPNLDVLLKSVEIGDCFLVKKQYDNEGQRLYHNVCVTGDTLVLTDKGEVPVKELVGKPFKAIVKGETYDSTFIGFWSNATQAVYKLTTEEGFNVKATRDHKFLEGNEWKELIEFRPGDKISINTSFNGKNYATVKDVEFIGYEEVYDCIINDVHAFSANNLIAHNCQEILIKHRSTCLLSHCNLGALTIDEIIPTFVNGMEWLCKVHKSTGVHLTGHYLSPIEDKQVGLGVIGLANLLAIEGISYEDLVNAMEEVLGISSLPYSKKAGDLAVKLYYAYERAADVARRYKLTKAFCVAPTANCSFKYKDREFYVTTPEIAPPVDISIERDSQTMGVIEVDYHPDCEIASEVGWAVYYRLNKCWQLYMDSTGLGHAISTNWWSDKVLMNKDFIKDWLKSPLKSLYYAWQVSPQVQDKSEVISSDNFQYKSEQNDGNLNCTINNQSESAYNTECSACAE